MMKAFKLVFLHFSFAFGIFHISRYLMRNKLIILCYHGFETHDETEFRPKLFIKKSTFKKRLELISKYNFPVLTLDDALSKLHNNNLPGNTIVITIDDGFYNVLNVASDILESYKFPSTLYLTTYYVKNNSPIFRLVIQYMFWKTEKKTACFDSCIRNKDKNKKIDIEDEKICERVLWDCINYGESECSELGRTSICQQLGELLDVDYQKICNDRTLSLLTMDEARVLSKKGIDIQLHTHRHRFPTDNENQAKKELTDNSNVLNEIINSPANHFCYPSGIWNKEQWPWLKQMNVSTAMTCDLGLNDSNTHLLELKRILDKQNMHEIEFVAELFGFMELLRALKLKLNTLLGRSTSKGS